MEQQQKILTLMIRRHGEQVWFYAYDFMPPRLSMDDECFVGYEASARLSELCGNYPQLLETGKDGKYRTARIRFENIGVALTTLPHDLCDLVVRELTAVGMLQAEKI